MKFNIIKYARKNAYAKCPKHEDKRPSLAIDIHGQYAGCFHCFSCGYSGKLLQEELKELKEKSKMEKYENPTPINWGDVADIYRLDSGAPPAFLVDRWNVSMDVLYDFDIGFDGEAATIPMCNEDEVVIGIQRQFPDGKKCCIEGSNLGLFIPTIISPQGINELFITEGCSDCVAIWDLGLYAIGRASAGTCQDMVVNWVEKNCPNTKIIIVSDNDSVGWNSAIDLEKLFRKEIFIYTALNKDIREQIKVQGKETVREILETL